MTSAPLLLFPTQWGDRYWNMAFDEAMWRWVAAARTPAVGRLYRWSDRPVVSIGYFQPTRDLERIACAQRLAFVRRPTGGGAIVHDAELTFAVAVPLGSPLAARVFIRRLREQVVVGLRARGLPACVAAVDGDPAAALCLRRPEPAAVTVEGQRVLAMAQRRNAHALLVHGILDQRVGLTGQDAETLLGAALARACGGAVALGTPPAEITALADALLRQRYGAADWNSRR